MDWLDRLTSKHWSSTCLCYPSRLSPWPWLTSTVIHVRHGARLLSGVLGIWTRVLWTNPSPQPLHMEFKFCCSLSYKVNYNYIFDLTQRMWCYCNSIEINRNDCNFHRSYYKTLYDFEEVWEFWNLFCQNISIYTNYILFTFFCAKYTPRLHALALPHINCLVAGCGQ